MFDGFRKKASRFFEVVAGIKQTIDPCTVSRPLLDLVEIAVIRLERIVGLFVAPTTHDGRLFSQQSGVTRDAGG